ncbi:hypothetical protein IID23_01820 [Patescibacteria group bacterium]|nr:hypothetical protein [Patescibacteria group bacterium]
MKILSRDDLNEKRKRLATVLPYFKFICLLVILLIGLFGVKLYFTNLLATSGVQLTATTVKIEKHEADIAKLENEISKLGSMKRIQKEAKKLGFGDTEKVQILKSQDPVAQKP